MKKLPKIYKGEILPKNNNKNHCILTNKEEKRDIEKVLDEVFNGIGHSYNTKVYITTDTNQYETYLVARNKDYIITLNNEKIPKEKIIDIKIKN